MRVPTAALISMQSRPKRAGTEFYRVPGGGRGPDQGPINGLGLWTISDWFSSSGTWPAGGGWGGAGPRNSVMLPSFQHPSSFH